MEEDDRPPNLSSPNGSHASDSRMGPPLENGNTAETTVSGAQPLQLQFVGHVQSTTTFNNRMTQPQGIRVAPRNIEADRGGRRIMFQPAQQAGRMPAQGHNRPVMMNPEGLMMYQPAPSTLYSASGTSSGYIPFQGQSGHANVVQPQNPTLRPQQQFVMINGPGGMQQLVPVPTLQSMPQQRQQIILTPQQFQQHQTMQNHNNRMISNFHRQRAANHGEMSVAEFIISQNRNGMAVAAAPDPRRLMGSTEPVELDDHSGPPALDRGDARDDECDMVEPVVNDMEFIETVFAREAREFRERHPANGPITHNYYGHIIEEDDLPFPLNQYNKIAERIASPDPVEELLPAMQTYAKEKKKRNTGKWKAKYEEQKLNELKEEEKEEKEEVRTPSGSSRAVAANSRRGGARKSNETTEQRKAKESSRGNKNQASTEGQPKKIKRRTNEVEQLLNMDFGPKEMALKEQEEAARREKEKRRSLPEKEKEGRLRETRRSVPESLRERRSTRRSHIDDETDEDEPLTTTGRSLRRRRVDRDNNREASILDSGSESVTSKKKESSGSKRCPTCFFTGEKDDMKTDDGENYFCVGCYKFEGDTKVEATLDTKQTKLSSPPRSRQGPSDANIKGSPKTPQTKTVATKKSTVVSPPQTQQISSKQQQTTPRRTALEHEILVPSGPLPSMVVPVVFTQSAAEVNKLPSAEPDLLRYAQKARERRASVAAPLASISPTASTSVDEDDQPQPNESYFKSWNKEETAEWGYKVSGSEAMRKFLEAEEVCGKSITLLQQSDFANRIALGPVKRMLAAIERLKDHEKNHKM